MIRAIFSSCTIFLVTSSLLWSADWTAFRGADGNGKSPDTGLQKQWGTSGPALLWTADFVGTGYSNIAIADEKIYITGNVDRSGKILSMVFCLDKAGKKIWENDNGTGHTERRRYPGTRGTPTIDGGFVYDVSPVGEAACFDAKTGNKIWNRNLLKGYSAKEPQWLIGFSGIIDGDLYICPLGGGKPSAVAMNKKTGKTVWEAPVIADPAGYVTPYVFEFEGQRVVAIISDVSVEGLDVKTGKKLFSIPWENNRGTNCTMPIYQNGNLFLTTGYGFGAKLFKLTKNTSGTITPTEVWYEKRFDNQHGGVILTGNHVYGTTHNGSWSSINFMTGEIGYLSRSAGKGSVHFADGLLYGLTEDNKTVLLMKPEPKAFVELSRFELPNNAEGKSWAHPVVLDGKLYLRHAQYLYCYDVKAK